METPDTADLLYGVPAIAAHMQMTDRQVYHLSAAGSLPTFKIGGKVCAKRSSIARWLAKLEAQAAGGEGARP